AGAYEVTAEAVDLGRQRPCQLAAGPAAGPAAQLDAAGRRQGVVPASGQVVGDHGVVAAGGAVVRAYVAFAQHGFEGARQVAVGRGVTQPPDDRIADLLPL